MDPLSGREGFLRGRDKPVRTSGEGILEEAGMRKGDMSPACVGSRGQCASTPEAQGVWGQHFDMRRKCLSVCPAWLCV